MSSIPGTKETQTNYKHLVLSKSARQLRSSVPVLLLSRRQGEPPNRGCEAGLRTIVVSCLFSVFSACRRCLHSSSAQSQLSFPFLYCLVWLGFVLLRLSLTRLPWLALNLQRSSCLTLLSGGMTGVRQHSQDSCLGHVFKLLSSSLVDCNVTATALSLQDAPHCSLQWAPQCRWLVSQVTVALERAGPTAASPELLVALGVLQNLVATAVDVVTDRMWCGWWLEAQSRVGGTGKLPLSDPLFGNQGQHKVWLRQSSRPGAQHLGSAFLGAQEMK